MAATTAVLNSITDGIKSSKGDSSQTISPTIVSQPPPSDCVKINFDGSGHRSSTAGGFIIRDADGKPLFAATRGFGSTTVPVAEATALRNSLASALQLNYSHVVVEGDSKLVIDAVKGVIQPP